MNACMRKNSDGTQPQPGSVEEEKAAQRGTRVQNRAARWLALLPEFGFEVVTDAGEVLGESVTVLRLQAVVDILHQLL